MGKADRKRKRESGRVVMDTRLRVLTVGMRLQSDRCGGCESKKVNETELRVKDCIGSNGLKR